MKKHLRVISRGEDSDSLLKLVQTDKEDSVVFDLRDAEPNYEELLEQIFECNAIHVW